jgi:hypothetical protein
MSRRLIAQVVTAAITALVVADASEATIRTENLVKNPGAEEGSAASDAAQIYSPPQWTMFRGPRFTAIHYGAPGFPTAQQGAALSGGRNFFAGGPPVDPDAGTDDNSASFSRTDWLQSVPLPAETQEDVDAGRVQLTVAGCLGGYADQNDAANFTVEMMNSGGGTLALVSIQSPTAAERKNQTGLVAQDFTAMVQPGIRSFNFVLGMSRTSGADTYNDGYADNLLVALSAAGGPTPKPVCSVPGAPPAGGGGGGNPGGGGGGSPVTPFLVAKGSSRATLKSGRVAVLLKCLSHENCSGRLALTVPRLPHASKVTLGSQRFTIAAGKTGSVKVRLGRRAKSRLSALSARQLRKLKVTATVTLGKATDKFPLRLRR